MTDHGKWAVAVQGSASAGEIAIVRERFELGQRTQGYYGHKKILVLHCQVPIPDEMWSMGLLQADKMARERNEAEEDAQRFNEFNPETQDQIALIKLIQSTPEELDADMEFWRQYWRNKTSTRK